ncbi:MAG TPA: hypothetical protein ENK66_01670 [Arcobacter sp.]|nr:hypothetical protein [Arcobacter sp.]
MKSRNYDKEPLIILNNFTSLVFGITFWLIFNSFMVYIIFFGEVIDWSQNKDLFAILKDELEKSFRFGTVLVGVFVANLMAYYALYKNIKRPKQIILKANSIRSDKNFNDLEYLELKDIQIIKKSFFPLLLTGHSEQGLSSLIGLLVVVPFILLASLISLFIKIVTNKDFKLFNYITLYIVKEHRVLNIFFASKQDYIALEEYFEQNLNIELNSVKKSFTISNFAGENDEK